MHRNIQSGSPFSFVDRKDKEKGASCKESKEMHGYMNSPLRRVLPCGGERGTVYSMFLSSFDESDYAILP